MDEMFVNRRTGAKAKVLRSYKDESESDSIMRLEAEGWAVKDVDFHRDEDGVFHANKPDKAEGMED